MKTINMITAVLLAIKSFEKEEFSIYNLTDTIRGSVNDGDYELTEYVDEVYHNDVKSAFLELWDNDILDHLRVDYNIGGYRLYSAFQSPQPNTTITTSVVNAVKSTTIPPEVQQKIYAYLKKNGQSSMKSIQSRLKGYTYTCKEIKDLLDNIGLIDPTTKSNPDSKVLTVKI